MIKEALSRFRRKPPPSEPEAPTEASISLKDFSKEAFGPIHDRLSHLLQKETGTSGLTRFREVANSLKGLAGDVIVVAKEIHKDESLRKELVKKVAEGSLVVASVAGAVVLIRGYKKHGKEVDIIHKGGEEITVSAEEVKPIKHSESLFILSTQTRH